MKAYVDTSIITELDDNNESVISPQQSFWLRSLVHLLRKEVRKVPVAINPQMLHQWSSCI